ncbi:glutathione S-transferase family protein [Mesobacterium sp. TK19101]|uniref:Glutathione S-transferase family protein n=1 Tax=Mesobacterium hydrothermale TaxID=3111907 RepID=A0ABU6HFC5_9RHOB|nr:glutathione S-transferase family protein [Mesobacterium sp. TK19101]MEC3859775.1 glutathione S-transferase family protein [Mesobacterium sp. TK19101]
MLTLLTFAGDSHDPSFSPFCVKAMCLLQMSGLDWQRKDVAMPRNTPHGRLPVLLDGDQVIADSSFIQAHLEARGVEFNAGLSAAQKAQSHALIRMVEENLRCGLVTDRWLNAENWLWVKQAFFGKLPGPLKGIVPNIVRRKVRRAMEAQGIAQFDEPDRLARLGADLEALTVVLGDQPFLFGDAPTAADAAILPVLSMIDGLPNDTGLRRLMRANAALVAYVDRARPVLYPPAEGQV